MKKKSQLLLWFVALCSIQAVAGQDTDRGQQKGPMSWSPANEPSGFESELRGSGYVHLAGLGVRSTSGRELENSIVLTKGVVVNRRVTKYWIAYVAIPDRDQAGRAQYQFRNAFEYELHANEVPLQGDDNGCKSLLHPHLQVIAIGKWKSRKNARQGGYAHSIRYAWVADPSLEKLRPISPESVACAINDDRD